MIVSVPGSKSIASRALVCAALAAGSSEVGNVPDGDDTQAMLACLARLGIPNERAGSAVKVDGRGGVLRPASATTLHAGLAGTTSRFVTALAALADVPITIDGFPPLRQRPFAPLHDALVQLGVVVDAAEGWGQLPVTVTGPTSGKTVQLRGDVSSQYVTALMLIGPCLPDGIRIELSSELVSRPYVEMTAAVMAAFGATGIAVGARTITVEPGGYRAAAFSVEPDASSASYPMAIAAIAGTSVTVAGLGADSLQSDARFADVLAGMGCSIERAGDDLTVTGPVKGELIGVDLDMAEISDLVPTLAAVALFARTPTTIRGVGFIRSKESDRLGDLAAELRKLGGDVRETDDGLVVGPSRLHGGDLATHHDHRLAMAFGVIARVVPGITLDDPGVVSKSWPAFWTAIGGLG